MPRTRLRSSNGSVPFEHGIVGKSEAIKGTIALVTRIAGTPLTVMLQGETGTGKELLARLVHAESARADRPMFAINCGALKEEVLESELFGHEAGSFTGAARRHRGLIELADGGDLFLDEIGEMSQSLQVKLLRVIEQREIRRVGGTEYIPVDVRIIAATHRNLLGMVKKGTFRLDLYHRLAVFPIDVPPLRERDRDVLLIARHFLADWRAKGLRRRLGRDAEQALMAYTWPGNVRELYNVICRVVLRCVGGRISAADIERALPVQLELPLHGAQEQEPEQAIVAMLAEQGPQPIGAICEQLQQSKTNVARHLRALRADERVVMQGKGRGTRYALADRSPQGRLDHLDIDEREREILGLLLEHGAMSRSELEDHTEHRGRTILRILASLKSAGLVVTRGKGRGRVYRAKLTGGS